MLRKLVQALRCLKDDERGAVLLYFTVALFPLLAAAGAAMDLGHVFLVKQKLTNAAIPQHSRWAHNLILRPTRQPPWSRRSSARTIPAV